MIKSSKITTGFCFIITWLRDTIGVYVLCILWFLLLYSMTNKIYLWLVACQIITIPAELFYCINHCLQVSLGLILFFYNVSRE